MKRFVLYNPFAGNNSCEKLAKKLNNVYNGLTYVSMCEVDYNSFFKGLAQDDEIIICGGDGTLNRFINDVSEIEIINNIYYYPLGSGNDFARELGYEKGASPFIINDYLKNLPTVEINGESRLFLNGIGYGIDGYCCEVGDALRAENEKNKTNKEINYTAIAIKGLLFYYKPTDAIVKVDGEEHIFKKVWIAPTMKGKHYGGGMTPCPAQDRGDGKLSVMVFHGSGKLKSLMIFPSIFSGEHIKKTKNVTVFSGEEISVSFSEPRPLQIDGETVLNVTEYHATTKTKVMV